MEMKLNHSDLSAMLAKEAGISVSKAESFTKALFDIIIEGLESDGIVKINGFGTFKITDVASRSSVNVNTGEKFEIKGHKKLTFIPADSLKDDVNQPFAMFEPVEVDESYMDDESADVDETDDKEVEQPVETADVPIVEEAPAEHDTASVTEVQGVVEDDAPAEDVPAEEPVMVQERPAEPVLVRVPKKERKFPAVEEKKKKKNFKWLYVTLSALAAAAVLCFCYFTVTPADIVKETADIPAKAAESPVAQVVKEETKAPDAVTAATVVDATTAATPQNIELPGDEKAVQDIAAVQESENNKPYEFVMIEELKALPLKDITLADTELYEITGEWGRHTVVAGETLTRIALKHYGDKKLWPYIVKHNSMSRPDDLRKGMVLSIPKLEPQK